MTTTTIIRRYKRADDWDDLTPEQQTRLINARVRANTDDPFVPWQDEIDAAYRAIMDATNIDPDAVRYRLPGGVLDLSGPRALAWLENQVIGPLRIPYGPAHYVRYTHVVTGKVSRLHRTGIPGTVDCPFTGTCYDYDYLNSLTDDLRAGSTVRDALMHLEDVRAELIAGEIDAYTSEDYARDSLADEGPWEWPAGHPEQVTTV